MKLHLTPGDIQVFLADRLDRSERERMLSTWTTAGCVCAGWLMR